LKLLSVKNLMTAGEMKLGRHIVFVSFPVYVQVESRVSS